MVYINCVFAELLVFSQQSRKLCELNPAYHDARILDVADELEAVLHPVYEM
jgi:hypothetical protein